MYYCTLYMANKRKTGTSIWFCFKYNSETDAQMFLDRIIDRAQACGAVIEAVDNHYYITGELEFSTPRIFVKSTHPSCFIVGLETDDTVGSKAPKIDKATIHKSDGPAMEKMIQRALEQENDYKAKKQKKVNANLLRFSNELDTATDLRDILHSVIKFAGQDTDKEKLIDLAIKKIQGQTDSVNWYDKLSELND